MPFYRVISRNIINCNVNLATAPSQFVVQKLRENNLFEQCKSIKIPLGIGLNEERVIKDFSRNKVIFLYVGALSKHKGTHVLIQAFNDLDCPNVELHIVEKDRTKMN